MIDIADDLDDIEEVDSSYIKTKNASLHIVETLDAHHEYLIKDIVKLNTICFDDIQVKLLKSSPILGMIAVKKGEFEKHYWPPCSSYLAIEIRYMNGRDKLNRTEENKILQSYIFELADTAGIALQPSELRCPADDFINADDYENDSDLILRDLITSNEGMSYFISGIQISNQELKFLSFYKVLEYFSPVALKIDGSELMRKKLDTPQKSFNDGKYIQSIFDLAQSINYRFNDEDLIKAAFQKCVDFPGLFNTLPTRLSKVVKKQLKIQEINYDTDQQTINSARNMVAKVIYKTRNRVVHAKSNFELSGDEISTTEDFTHLNDFMKKAASQAIRWYSRLPAHLRNV